MYPPNQKLPIWSIDSGIIAYNCQKHGMPHPVLAMPMWDGAGNRVFDLSGRRRHGTIIGPTWESNDNLSFDNGTSRVTIEAFSPTITRAPLTINMRLYYDSVQSQSYPRLFWDQNYKIDIIVRHSDLKISIMGGTNYTVNTIPVNRWFDLTIVATSTTNGKIYFDGIFQEDLTGEFTDNLAAIILGNRGDYLRPFEGNLRGVNVYNVCLNATQVKFLSDNPDFMYQIPEELYGYVELLEYIPNIIIF